MKAKTNRTGDQLSTIDPLIDGLATYRLVRLAIDDSIFERQREHVLEALRVAGYDKVVELASCPWCLGVYVAFGVVAARAVAPRQWSWVAKGLAFSAVAGAIDRMLQ